MGAAWRRTPSAMRARRCRRFMTASSATTACSMHIGDAPWGTAGLFLGSSSAVNHGNINLGIHDMANSSSAAAVSFSGEGSFVNARDGTIYLGRTPQNHKGDVAQDVAVSLGVASAPFPACWIPAPSIMVALLSARKSKTPLACASRPGPMRCH